jgi:16S rRNA (uracil1498-N3)-methyltransferase
MYNFFIPEEEKQDNGYLITGNDYNHLKNVLRIKIGEEIIVSSGSRGSLCVVKEISDSAVFVEIKEENYLDTALPINLYLFQGLPKGDKMELIIQKCVELGISGIYPVEMSRSIVKIEEKKKSSKVSRWNNISEAAAKQSKQNFIPEIFDIIPFGKAIEKAKELDLLIVPYENEDGMKSTMNTLQKIKKGMSVGIFIGPEGGFDPGEIEKAKEIGGDIISLGKRILRTETAAITATSMCMLYSEMNL